jgi:hypothetical protein
MQTKVPERPMAKERGPTMPIRIDVHALKRAKIAAAYKGITVMEFASEVLLEAADRVIEQETRRSQSGPPPPRKPKGSDS